MQSFLSFLPQYSSSFSPPLLGRIPPCNSTTARRHVLQSTSVISAASSSSSRNEKVKEIRVCVNRTCSKQGSRETLSVLSDIAPPGVSVKSCGCLGRCGDGPNLVVLPAEVMVGHCATAARAAEILEELCCGKGEAFDPWRNLEALTLRKKGEVELVEKGNPSQAVAFLSEAISLNPSGGIHVLYKIKSSARLAMGDIAGALEDAKEASLLDPEFPQAYICQGDVYFAMEDWVAADKAYSTALHLDPSIRRSKSFRARVAKLNQMLAATSTS